MKGLEMMKKYFDKILLGVGLSIIGIVFIVYSILDKVGLVTDYPILWYETLLGFCLTIGESITLIVMGMYIQRKVDKKNECI